MNHHNDRIKTSALGSETHPSSARMLFLGYFSHDSEANRWRNRAYYGLLILFAGLALRWALTGQVPTVVLDLVMTVAVGGTFAFINLMSWRYTEDLDELHRRIMQEGITFSYYVTITAAIIGCFAVQYGWLTASGLFTWILATQIASRGVGLLLAGRKYR